MFISECHTENFQGGKYLTISPFLLNFVGKIIEDWWRVYTWLSLLCPGTFLWPYFHPRNLWNISPRTFLLYNMYPRHSVSMVCTLNRHMQLGSINGQPVLIIVIETGIYTYSQILLLWHQWHYNRVCNQILSFHQNVWNSGSKMASMITAEDFFVK